MLKPGSSIKGCTEIFRVAVVETKSAYEGTKKALELLQARRYLKPEEKVLVKPNYVCSDMPATGVTTDPMTVKAVVEYLLENGFSNKNIVVGEGGMSDYSTLKTFEKVGLMDALRELKVPVVDLNKDERLSVKIPGAKALKQVDIAKSYVECDAIISLAKLKVHSMATVTLSMKNMMGGILPKSIMHSDIHNKIADLNRRFAPRISLIDGIIGCQTAELAADPVCSDVVICSNNAVAADAVGAYLMGFEPGEVLHLRYAKEAGLGEIDMRKIKIIGDDIERRRKQYLR